jgi:MFS family permease
MRALSSDPQTNRTLRHSLKDAAAFAGMTGVGETYLSAFALFLGATTAQIGVLASLPPMLASLVQLVSAWLGRIEGRRRALILAGASIQGAAWLPLLLLPLAFPASAVTLLIIFVVVYHAGAHLASPQWSSLIGDLVSARRRGRYFGLRTQLVTAITFVSLMLGGFVLFWFSEREQTATGFAVLFIAACVARFVSVYQLARMHDPGGHVAPLEPPRSLAAVRRLWQSDAVRFSLFFAMMQFAVAISAPFFTVYLLRDLELDYLSFTLIIGTAVLVQFMTLSQWGRISDVFGNRRILGICCVFISIVPALWVFSPSIFYIISIQFLSGFSWAGFNLSCGNYLYDLISPQRRATYLAIHNVLANIGIFGGALLGGFLGALLPESLTLANWTWDWASSLYGLFLLSAVLRTIVLLIFIPRLREVRNVKPISTSQVIFRAARVHALAGLVFEIIGRNSRK